MNHINIKKQIRKMNRPVELSELEIEQELAFWTIGDVDPWVAEGGAQLLSVKNKAKNYQVSSTSQIKN